MPRLNPARWRSCWVGSWWCCAQGDTLQDERAEDAVLAASACAGEQPAAAQIYRRFERVVRGIAWRFAKADASATEDLMQEIWVHLFCVALAGWDPSRGSLGSF